jgi:hypothetical protein
LRALDRVEIGLVSLVAVAAAGAAYWRLYYGVDFTDESFYVVLPYRLVLGARPFVDEVSVTQQTAAVLMYPFVRAYYAIAGPTGIVLFVRQLYFAFSVGVAAAVLTSVRPLVGFRRGVLVAASAILFVPFDIHSLSYDTLGCGLFTAGTLLTFLAVRGPESRLAHALGAVCHALAVFAYPPLVIAVGAAHAVAVAASPGPRRLCSIGAGVGAVGVPVAALGALAAGAGFHTVALDYRHSSRYLGQAGGPGKLVAIAAHEWHRLLLPAPLVIAVLVLVVVCFRTGPRVVPTLLLPVLPLLVLPPHPTFYAASLEFAAHLGWLALPLLLLVHARPGARLLFAGVWLPSLLAGLTTAYSSANGATNLGIGFFPAAIVTLVYLVWALEEIAPGTAELPRRLAALPLVVTAGLLALFEVVPVYRDGGITTLDARIGSGPFAGLLTSPRKRAFLQSLEHDLAGVGPRCTILFLDDFPAGYLLTRARPDTNAAWVATVAPSQVAPYQDQLLAYLRRAGLPDVVVLMQRIPYAPPGSARREHYPATDPISRALRANAYATEVSTLDYRIYDRGSAACRPPSSTDRAGRQPVAA